MVEKRIDWRGDKWSQTAYNKDNVPLGHLSYEPVGRHTHWCWYQYSEIRMSPSCLQEVRDKQKELYNKVRKKMKLKKIVDYVKENYAKLPESDFDKEGKCVIIYVKKDYDEGWGHHGFEGLGVTKKGQLKWYFSSGCSCAGGTHSEDASLKSVVVEEDPYDAVEEFWKGGTPKLTSYEFSDY